MVEGLDDLPFRHALRATFPNQGKAKKLPMGPVGISALWVKLGKPEKAFTLSSSLLLFIYNVPGALGAPQSNVLCRKTNIIRR